MVLEPPDIGTTTNPRATHPSATHPRATHPRGYLT